MEERIARIIGNLGSLEDVVQFEANARDRNALTDEIKEALKARSIELGRMLIAAKTGLDLSDLSRAEEIIVQTAAEYVAIKEREGSNANRTLLQLRNRGLIEAAETSVAKSKPTQGFETLADADREGIAFIEPLIPAGSLLPDGIHLSAAGNRVWASAVVAGIFDGAHDQF
jgi:lysophospholipase L1-like esterase